MWSLKPKRRRSLIEMTTSGGAGVPVSGCRREWRLPPGRSNNPTHSARRAEIKTLFVRWELTVMVDYVSTVHSSAKTTQVLTALFILESQIYVHNSSVTHSSQQTRRTTDEVLNTHVCTRVSSFSATLCFHSTMFWRKMFYFAVHLCD